MNLGNALSKEKVNKFVCNPFTGIYDDYMNMNVISVTESKPYMQCLLNKLDFQNNNNIHIQRIYRSILFVSGADCMEETKFDSAFSALDSAKEAGLTYDDPLLQPLYLQDCLGRIDKGVRFDTDPLCQENQRKQSLISWAKGVIAAAEYNQSQKILSPHLQADLLKQVFQARYEPAYNLIGRYVKKTLVEIFRAPDIEEALFLMHGLKDFYGYRFSNEQDKEVVSALLEKMYLNCLAVNSVATEKVWELRNNFSSPTNPLLIQY